jgi:hypothetical protein
MRCFPAVKRGGVELEKGVLRTYNLFQEPENRRTGA